MQQPVPSVRFSASSLARNEKCPSSYARSLEMADFCEAYGIELPAQKGMAAMGNKGTRLHHVLAKIGFSSVALGMGEPGSPWKKVRQQAAQLGVKLERGDVWFLGDCLRKRDLLIEDLVQRAGGAAQIAEFEVSLDATRLFHTLQLKGRDGSPYQATFSGQPDVRVVVVNRRGERYVLLLDYKTGYAEQEGSTTNRQLVGLAALEHCNYPQTNAVGVSLLSRQDADPCKVDLVEFDQALLAAASGVVAAIASRSLDLARMYSSGKKGAPNEELSGLLDENARVGDHCRNCVGSPCCGRQQTARRQFSAETLVASASERMGRTISSVVNDPSTMNLELLAATIEEAQAVKKQAALFDSLRESAEDLGRKLMGKGIVLPGVGLKDGAKRMVLRDEPIQVADPENVGSSMQQPRDVSPSAIYDQLKGVIPGIDYPTFVYSTCGVDEGAVRELLADQHKIPAKDVYEKILVPLAEKNPFVMRANTPSVVLLGPAKALIRDADQIVVTSQQAAGPGTVDMPALPQPSAGKSAAVGGIKR